MGTPNNILLRDKQLTMYGVYGVNQKSKNLKTFNDKNAFFQECSFEITLNYVYKDI